MKTAALYIRVSTEEQRDHGISVDNQIDSLVDYCNKNNLQYVIYNDAGISGHASYKKRPALLQLIEDCKQNKIRLILFTRLDRWFRSVKDYYLVQDQICDVPWKAIWEDYETETSSGQLKVNIMLSVAEAEAARTSEKVSSVLKYKKEIGEWCGRAPKGFCIKDKHLIIDEEQKEFINKIFTTYKNTLSIEKTYKTIKEFGKISRSNIRFVLHNDIYVGSYITKEEHEFIMKKMKQSTHTSEKQYPYLFGSMLRCPLCGGKMVGKSASAGRAYGCRHCNHFSIAENKLEKLMLQQLSPALDEVKFKAETKKKKDNSKEIKAIENKILRLKDLYIDGEISREEYNDRKASYEAQIYALNPDESHNLPTLPKRWKDAYNALSVENRRVFWKSIITEIQVAEDRKSATIIFT